jgi:hypothetical protein
MMPHNYLDMLDEMRAISQTGINYAKSPYDLKQYQRLLELASEQYSERPRQNGDRCVEYVSPIETRYLHFL